MPRKVSGRLFTCLMTRPVFRPCANMPDKLICSFLLGCTSSPRTATYKYRGLMVDFEDFPKSAQSGYLVLLGELSTDLHAKGMKLYVSVQARNEDFDYPAIAARIDGAVIMNYDEHYPGGKPGPVASQDWFVANLEAV